MNKKTRTGEKQEGGKTAPSRNFLEEKVLLEGGETEPEGFRDPDISVFRPDREGIRKVLGDLEAYIMEFVCDNLSPKSRCITVREVFEAFRQDRTIAYTTVMTTMARLARKNLLKATKIENAYVYTPTLTKEEFIDNFVGRILENLLVSFASTTESHLQRL